MERKITIAFIIFLLAFPFASLLASSAQGEVPQETRGVKGGRTIDLSQAMDRQGGVIRPVLTLAPREISFGAIGPGESINGMFALKNLGSGSLNWSTSGPEGWTLQENQNLSGAMEEAPNYLRITLKSLGEVAMEGKVKTRRFLYPLQLILEAGGDTIVCRKDLAPGPYREVIKLTSNGGTRSIFVAFKVVEAEAKPLIGVEPLRVDFGIVAAGKQVAKQVRLTNKGREPITWQATVRGAGRADTGAPVRPGRYVSFLNEEVKGREGYAPPAHLKDTLALSGRSLEDNGYPSFFGVNSTVKYQFWGTGITLYLWNIPDGGNLAVYMDEQFVHVYNCYAEQKEAVEFPVADMLADGLHTLTLVSDGGRALIEGVRIHGHEPGRGNPGWIRVNPRTGLMTRETDYVNIVLNTQNLNPGIYADDIVFNSERGSAVVEVSGEVVAEQSLKTIDVYRFVKGSDYIYTANPQAEANNLQVRGYRKQGIAFRLFSPDMPGTTPFYRWYNAQRGDHFYSYDYAGAGKSLRGYVFEGILGNIATSRLTNTRELYRWFNPATGGHFYTTAQNGGDMAGKGYKFDGIAGYVR
jgi:hypothetical protein